MKKIKSIISVILCAAVCCGALAANAAAKSSGSVRSIKLKSKATVTIPSSKKTLTKAYKVTVKTRGKASKGFTAKSSKPSVADVKVSKGYIKVTAKKAGKAKITVTTKEKNSKGKKLSKKMIITVKKASTSVSEPASEPASEPNSEPASEPATEPASEPSSEPASEPNEEKDIKTMIKEKMESLKFCGVVRVTKNDELLFEVANGTISDDSDALITVDSQFAIGSVSKQFTAAAVMLLKEDGKLSVDDKIDKWFPDYKYAGTITVKNLLTMRSGIPDYANEYESLDEYYSRYNYSDSATEEENRKATRDWIFSRDLTFAPDTKTVYSNSNYFLLAEIVEKTSGISFTRFVKEKIFAPLNMNDTDTGSELVDRSRLVTPITGKYPAEIYTKGVAFGDGGIVSTAADMDKWMTSLRRHTLLSEESINEMTTDYSQGSGIKYGYGFMFDSKETWNHEGSIDSYLTYELIAPKKGYNVFVSTNRDDYNIFKQLSVFVKNNTY